MNREFSYIAVFAALIAGLSDLRIAGAGNGDTVLGHTYGTADGTLSIVSIVSETGGTPRWTYLSKDDGSRITDECSRQALAGKTMPNDLGSFALPFENAVFGDTTSKLGVFSAATEGMFAVSTQHNFDFVGSEGALYGEVIHIDVRSGFLSFSYRMGNHPYRQHELGLNEIGYPYLDVGNNDDFFGEGGPDSTLPTLVFHPEKIGGNPFFDTSWLLVATGYNMLTSNRNARTEQSMRVALGRDLDNPFFVYDRNGRPLPIDNSVTFNCFGEVDLVDLVGPAIDQLENGGWAHLIPLDLHPLGAAAIGTRKTPPISFMDACLDANDTSNGSCDLGLLVYKLETFPGITLFTSQNRFDF